MSSSEFIRRKTMRLDRRLCTFLYFSSVVMLVAFSETFLAKQSFKIFKLFPSISNTQSYFKLHCDMRFSNDSTNFIGDICDVFYVGKWIELREIFVYFPQISHVVGDHVIQSLYVDHSYQWMF